MRLYIAGDKNETPELLDLIIINLKASDDAQGRKVGKYA